MVQYGTVRYSMLFIVVDKIIKRLKFLVCCIGYVVYCHRIRQTDPQINKLISSRQFELDLDLDLEQEASALFKLYRRIKRKERRLSTVQYC